MYAGQMLTAEILSAEVTRTGPKSPEPVADAISVAILRTRQIKRDWI